MPSKKKITPRRLELGIERAMLNGALDPNGLGEIRFELSEDTLKIINEYRDDLPSSKGAQPSSWITYKVSAGRISIQETSIDDAVEHGELEAPPEDIADYAITHKKARSQPAETFPSSIVNPRPIIKKAERNVLKRLEARLEDPGGLKYAEFVEALTRAMAEGATDPYGPGKPIHQIQGSTVRINTAYQRRVSSGEEEPAEWSEFRLARAGVFFSEERPEADCPGCFSRMNYAIKLDSDGLSRAVKEAEQAAYTQLKQELKPHKSSEYGILMKDIVNAMVLGAEDETGPGEVFWKSEDGGIRIVSEYAPTAEKGFEHKGKKYSHWINVRIVPAGVLLSMRSAHPEDYTLSRELYQIRLSPEELLSLAGKAESAARQELIRDEETDRLSYED